MTEIFEELFERRLRVGDNGQHLHSAFAIRVRNNKNNTKKMYILIKFVLTISQYMPN